MLTDGLILALIASAGLSFLGVWKQNKAVIFISSLGWMISALQIYDQTAEPLPMALVLMLSIAQFFLVRGD